MGGDASCAQGRVQLVGKTNLPPVVPTVVGPALAVVDSSNIDLTDIVFGPPCVPWLRNPRDPTGLRARACHGL
jgi:hypothetical protein